VTSSLLEILDDRKPIGGVDSEKITLQNEPLNAVLLGSYRRIGEFLIVSRIYGDELWPLIEIMTWGI